MEIYAVDGCEREIDTTIAPFAIDLLQVDNGKSFTSLGIIVLFFAHWYRYSGGDASSISSNKRPKDGGSISCHVIGSKRQEST